MRKSVKLLLLLILCSVIATACSIGQREQKERSPVTLKVVTHSERAFSLYKSYLEEKFPHVTLEVIGILELAQAEQIDIVSDLPDHKEKLRELNRTIIEEENPDIYFGYAPELYSEQVELVDLNERIQFNQVELNPIQRSLHGLDQSPGKKLTYITPTYSRDLLYMNRNKFQSNNITEPITRLTWEQFRQLAESFAKSEPLSSVGYVLPSGNLTSNLLSLARMNGIDLQDETGRVIVHHAVWRQLAEQMTDDLNNGVATLKDTSTSAHQWSETAMYMGSPADIYHLVQGGEKPEDWFIMDMPYSLAAPGHSYSVSDIFSIDSKSRHIEEAWELLAYLLTEEAAIDIAGRNLSSGIVTYTEHIISGGLSLDVLNNIQEQSTAAPPSSVSLSEIGYKALYEMLNKQLSSVMNDDTELSDAWDQLEEMITAMNAASENFRDTSLN